MSTITIPQTVSSPILPATPRNPKHEQGRYLLPDGTLRVIYAQRINGYVRLTDEPGTPSTTARAYVIQSRINVWDEDNGTETTVDHAYAHLQALVNDYIGQAKRQRRIPLHTADAETDQPIRISEPPRAIPSNIWQMSPYDLILATNARSYSHAAEIRDQLATTEKRAIASTAAARVKEQYA